MILVAIGSNQASRRFGPPRAVCEAAVAALTAAGAPVVRQSRWYRSAPVPASAQPWYVNGVAELETALSPDDLLALLHRIEAGFGRRRERRNGPRTLDLDLLAHGALVSGPLDRVLLPHPRLHLRAFVLLPLEEVAPDWRHPRLGLGIGEMLAALPPGQVAEVLTSNDDPINR